jgi:signal transduction histidine kinase
MASVTGITTMPRLLPYGFLIYGFGVARSLLVRYRNAADALEATADDLRQATGELTTSYIDLGVVQDELARSRQLASVGELAAAIAHEVRNPIAVITNATATLRRQGLSVSDRDILLGMVDEESARLDHLVADLLRYARPTELRREEVALGDVFDGLSLAVPASCRVEVPGTGDPDPRVWADAGLLVLALQNLVANACEAMPDGGVVVLAVHRATKGVGSGLCISVTDSGHGMDARTLRRAMDPFFSTRPSGTGLGLPTAGRIVEAHGGTIKLVSRPGEGTTVTLYFPDRPPGAPGAPYPCA